MKALNTLTTQILEEVRRIEERLAKSAHTLYLGCYLTEGHHPSNGYKGVEALPKVEIYQHQSLIWGDDITLEYCNKLTEEELGHILSQLKEM